MTTSRVYVPCSLALLSEIVVAGGVGPAPVMAHAVTPALRTGYAEAGEEEWEYAAMSAAAQGSIGLLTEVDPPRRVVLALDADSVLPVEGREPTLVEVTEVVPIRNLASVHVDSADAEEAVAAARDCWSLAEAGDADAETTVERCLDHELGWYAAQEIGDLLRP